MASNSVDTSVFRGKTFEEFLVFRNYLSVAQNKAERNGFRYEIKSATNLTEDEKKQKKNKAKQLIADKLRVEYDFLRREEHRHDNIVSLSDHILLEQKFYLIIESSDETLKQLVDRVGPFDELTAKKWTRHMVEGLYFIQTLQPEPVAHRNLTLDNWVVVGDGLKLRDFGTSRAHGLNDGGDEQPLIAVQYWTPKHVMCHAHSLNRALLARTVNPLKADLWALGVALYYLVTGSFPFPELRRGLTAPEYEVIFAKQMKQQYIPIHFVNWFWRVAGYDFFGKFLSSLLVESKNRATITALRSHQWLREN